ncbi:MAG: hypothetical protein CVV61_05800 [Tenericutes bacterium HGW-Tenericutes-6]|nr:MAG: hypothetical protein CVV61_05800 [Tenericutes bacterium HGW-Tenericutes-6]
MIDIHAHILPGVDDGAKTMEESIVLLRKAILQGTTHQVLSPHVQSSVSKVSPEHFSKIFNNLKEEVKRHELPIELYLGAEINYRSHLSPDYKMLSLNQSKYVLVEFSPRIEAPIEDVVFDITRMGFIPIIAHVERYVYLDYSDYARLKSIGALLQVNSGALMGLNDKVQKKLSLKLLKDGLIDIIATDTHNIEKRPPNLKDCYNYLKGMVSDDYLEALFYKNAKPIIMGYE